MASSVPVISKDTVLVLFIPRKLATYRTRGSRFLSLHISTYSNWNFDCFLRYFFTNEEIRACLQRYHNRILMKAYTYFFLWRFGPTRAMVSSLMNFLDHTKRRTTFGRIPLKKWSALRRDKTQQSKETYTHAPDGIRNHSLNRTVLADLRIRTRGHWDRLMKAYMSTFYDHLLIVFSGEIQFVQLHRGKQ